MINQKNTFVSLAEQLALLNKNSVEVITKLNDVVTNRNSVVNVTLLNSDGTASTYQFPTVGQLKNEIDIANRNIRKLAGLADSTSYVSDGTTMRKIYVDDLNREPEPIDNLNTVSRFLSVNNSFFESMSNPMLAVHIDLNSKIDKKVNKVLSRRYIIKFQKDDNGNYTTDGQTSKKDFEDKFLNKNNIVIDDLTTWYDNPKNYGLFLSNEPYDEQVFDLDYDTLLYYGIFDVIGVDNDTINKKLWYVLGSLTYSDFSGNTKQLTIGDELIINKKDSSTKWQIKEISTAKSNYRVILERIEGLEPVPVILQALKIYSPENSNKSIKVSIGYDEYNVIFVKPINTDANIVSSTWSFGTCFYTNNLVLDTNDTVSMTRYYSETVFDYGAVLKDMIVKNIPSKYGQIPNVPLLDSTNFKVLLINKHLSGGLDNSKLKDLYAQKTTVKSQLDAINSAVISLTKEISQTQYNNSAEEQAARNQLKKLQDQQSSLSKSYASIVSQINSFSAGAIVGSPKYRIRGFWSFPLPVNTGYEGYQKNQEVVQFKIQYKYSAKGGTAPATDGFDLNFGTPQYNFATTTGDFSRQAETYSNPTVTSNDTPTTGYFSNWNQLLTDVRKRSYNKALDVWTWNIEDVSDANTPNINQLDIPIQENEKVDIRIKSISEVGWPNAAIESDWSSVMTIEFPDDLSQVGDENSLILQEAQQDETYIQLESKFNAKGLTTHLQQSYFVNDLYVAHTDVNLGTSVKDSSGKMIMANDLFKSLINRIAALEELILKAKGEMVVKLLKDTTETIISNGASVSVNITCEDYAEQSGSTRTYQNVIDTITNYQLQFQNIAAGSQLGLFSYRNYIPNIPNDNKFYNTTYNKGSLACYVDNDNKLNAQKDNQFIWFSDTSGVQQIYNSGNTSPINTLSCGRILYSKNWNVGLGLSGGTLPNNGIYASPIDIFDDVSWTGSTIGANSIVTTGNTDYQSSDFFPVTVHPYLDDIENYIYAEKDGVKLIAASAIFTIPINIYYKLDNTSGVTKTFDSTISSSPFVYRKLRVFLEPENLNRTFEFEIIFKIFRNRTYTKRPTGINYVNSNSNTSSSI